MRLKVGCVRRRPQVHWPGHALIVGGWLALALVGCAAAVGGPGAAARSGWSRPRALAVADQYVFAPQLAVAASGQALAGWFGGSPAQVSAGGSTGGVVRGTPWRGAKVVVDLGTVTGGFASPVVLSTRGSDSPGQLHVAVSGSGVAYAAWSEAFSGRWMIATTRAGRFSAPHRLPLPRTAQLLGLAAAQRGPAAAVWLDGVGSAGSLRYALLDADGRLGHVVTVAHLGGSASIPQFAINDDGGFAAAWMGRALEAVVCTPKEGCSRPLTVTLGNAHLGVTNNIPVVLTDDGTTVVLASGHANLMNGGVVMHGLWAVVRRRDAGFRVTPVISPTGDFPVATADGHGSVMVMFNVGRPPVKTLAWSLLGPSGARFSKPRIVPDRHTIYSPVIAANLSGAFVAAWTHASGYTVTSDTYSVVAAAGVDNRLEQPTTIAPGSQHVAAQTLATGIDGKGNAIVIWSEWINNEPHGLFAAIHRL
jgi:hypothetical protein